MAPRAVLVAGGMEATFRPELMFELGPFDLVVLGEGEHPLVELATRMRKGMPLGGITGTAERNSDGRLIKMPQTALTRERVARRDLQHPLRQDAVYGLLGAAGVRLSGRCVAQQGGARSAPGRDPLGPADHAQLLPDGLHVLLVNQLPARSAGQCCLHRAPGSRRMSAHDRADHGGPSQGAHDHFPGRYLQLHARPPDSAAVRGQSSPRSKAAAFPRTCSSSAPIASMP